MVKCALKSGTNSSMQDKERSQDFKSTYLGTKLHGHYIMFQMYLN